MPAEALAVDKEILQPLQDTAGFLFCKDFLRRASTRIPPGKIHLPFFPLSSKESKARLRFPNTKYAKEKGGDYDMSAFLVAEKTLHRIISYLDDELTRSAWLRSKFEQDLGANVAGDWKSALGQKMWDLNQLSLGYRYGDEKQDLLYTFSLVACSPIQAYKSLQCWLYQCCEGDIPKESKLYKFFDTVVVQHIGNSIIIKTSAYEQAEWG